MESAAATATTCHDLASAANNSIGMGATHMKGHCGFMPFPNSSSAAVESTATVARGRGCLRPKAMKVSPEGTAVEHTEILRPGTDPATAIQHDESVEERADFEGDLQRIVRTQLPDPHGLLEELDARAEGWRTAGLEVPRIEPGPLARREKHQIVEIRELKRELHKHVSQLHQPTLYATFEWKRLHPGGKLAETLIRDRVQQAGPVAVVTINGHRSNADAVCDGAHRDRRKTFPIENLACRRENTDCGVCLCGCRNRRCHHEYTAYT